MTMFIIAAIFIGTFVWYEMWLTRRAKEPLFDFGLLRYPAFRFGLFTVAIVALGEFGILFIMSLYFQGVRGLTAFETGVTLLPFAIGSFITAPLAGLFASRFGPKWIVTVGMLTEAIAIFLLSLVIQPDTSQLVFVPIFLLYGLGLGLAIAQLTNVVLSDIPPQNYGEGSGANNTLRQVGAAIGVAVLGAVLASSISATGSTLLSKNTVIPDAIKPAIQSNFDAGSASSGSVPTISIQGGGNGQPGTGGPGAGGPPQGNFPSIAAIGQEIKNIYDVAATDGTRNAARVASFFVLMGACSSLLIPGQPRETEELGEEMEGEPSEDSTSEESDVVVVSEPTSQANG